MIYVTLFVMFFRIGLFSFGGGLAMLPLIFQSVKDFGMMTASEFSDLVALSQVTPGPIAVNAATYVGFNGAGIPGALAATLRGRNSAGQWSDHFCKTLYRRRKLF